MTIATFDLLIDDLGAQSDGIAHHEGQTLFIPLTLPGERVRVAKTQDPTRPQLVEVLSPAPQRQTPPCPHFGICGGCRLQHMETEAMTAWKRATLQHLFETNHIAPETFLPTIVTPPASRRRARLAAHHGRHGVTLGFNKEQSSQLVDLTACPVLHPTLESLLPKLREALPLWLPKNGTCDIQLTLLAKGIDMLLIGGPTLNLDARLSLATLADKLDIAQLSWRKFDKSSSEPVAIRVPLDCVFGKIHVPFPAGSFLQATEVGESALIAFAKQAAGKAVKVLDLFCGLGGFGLSMPASREPLFIDIDGPAIDALGTALKGYSKARVERLNLVRDPPTTLVCDRYDAVIFDPPRGGAKNVAMRLAASHVPNVVMISCDAASFVRDAEILIKGGYKWRSVQPVDQFLWSPHIELAAHFTR